MEWLSMLYVYVVPFLRLLMRWRRRGVCECVMVQHDQQARHVVSSDASGELGVVSHAAPAHLPHHLHGLHAHVQPLRHEVALLSHVNDD